MGLLRVMLLVCGGGLVACSALVAPEKLSEDRCQVGEDEEDPCAAKGPGWRCGSTGRCEPCESSEETCDGQDNDCDMIVDEGLEEALETCDGLDNNCNGEVDEGHDLDGDGVTWCGGGTMEERDCDDADHQVYPAVQSPDGELSAAREECDGKDNDCDNLTDEDAASCQLDCEEYPCSGNLRCDPATKRCLAQRSVGSVCTTDFECGSGFCVSTAMLGLSSLAGERVCATACCRDSDCPDETACLIYRGGIRVCMPSRISDRQPGGGPCRLGSHCASGVCDNRRCLSPCASEYDCSGRQVCSLAGGAEWGNALGWSCGSAAGTRQQGETCSSFLGGNCESGVCRPETSTCAAPCGVDADCPLGHVCDYRDVSSFLDLDVANVPVCVESAEAVTVPTCCTAADCGAGLRCLPLSVGDATAMRCQAGPQ